MAQPLIVQQSWINDAEFIGYFVAAAEGDYARAGLDVVMVPGSAATVPERTLLEGTADIALAAPESVAATLRDTGADFRIVAAQFRKSPLGIVSRADDPVPDLASLAGRILAVPEMNRAMVEDLLTHAGLAPGAVALVPYAHDPAALMDRQIDGLVDFIVDPQYRLSRAGIASRAILLFDHGAPLPNNLAVVTGQTYRTRGEAIARWVAASSAGWRRNFRDPAFYPERLRGRPLVESRTLDHEIYANRAFRPLIDAGAGTMRLSAGPIEQMSAYLERVGLPSLRRQVAPL